MNINSLEICPSHKDLVYINRIFLCPPYVSDPPHVPEVELPLRFEGKKQGVYGEDFSLYCKT